VDLDAMVACGLANGAAANDEPGTLTASLAATGSSPHTVPLRRRHDVAPALRTWCCPLRGRAD
jgi:hypothetical protein